MTRQTRIPCVIQRGGTSKGPYFLASDLPANPALRDRVLLSVMGSPDARQIDGLGGADPLTSKVAIVSKSSIDGVDLDYLFCQVKVDEPLVDVTPNCGNMLAGVAPFALEHGLVSADDGRTTVRIHMVNSGNLCDVHIQTPRGIVSYDGDARIDGTPGTSAPVMIDFLNTAGSACGTLLPTGNVIDEVDSVKITCIDNGMPVVLLNAADFGLTGDESPAEIEKNTGVKERIESIRLKAGRQMNLGDVSDKTVPKMSLISAPVRGGLLNTRTFIPHRVHDAIGVLGSVSVATACVVDGSIAYGYLKGCSDYSRLEIEHPTGSFTVAMDVEGSGSLSTLKINRSALLRTARLLMRGEVLVADSAFSAPGKQ